MKKQEKNKKSEKPAGKKRKPARRSLSQVNDKGLAGDSAFILNTLADNSSEVVFIYDMDRRLRYVTPSFESLTGYTAASLKKKHFIKYFHPDDNERMLDAWGLVFSGREYNGQFRCITKQKAVKWCSALWKPVYDGHGQQSGVLRKERDITDSIIAEESLRKKEEKFFGLLENIEIGYFELDLRGNLSFFNDVLFELWSR